MNADIIPHVIANAFKVPGYATQIEALIGAAILKAERKAKHVAKMPKDMTARFGAAVVDPVKWRLKVLELVAHLEEKSPQSRKQLGDALGCTKETAAARADEAIRQGVVHKVHAKGYCVNRPRFLYAIGKGETT
jgi:biotin operon repressor